MILVIMKLGKLLLSISSRINGLRSVIKLSEESLSHFQTPFLVFNIFQEDYLNNTLY